MYILCMSCMPWHMSSASGIIMTAQCLRMPDTSVLVHVACGVCGVGYQGPHNFWHKAFFNTIENLVGGPQGKLRI